MPDSLGNSPLVEGDFYDGSFGPTILLILTSPTAVEWFRKVLADIADSPIGAVLDLIEQPGVSIGAALPGLRLALVALPSERHLVLARDGSFTWRCTDAEWRTASLMLEPFSQGQVGHQYMTSEEKDDAIIEISYGEQH